jgi:putative membrane protein
MKAVFVWLITAVAVAVAVWFVPGIEIAGPDATLSIGILAVILAFINAFIKPVLKLIALPITILTLGIFALILNTLLLYLAAWVGNGLFGAGLLIESFWSALFASIVISLVSAILSAITGVNDDKKERKDNQDTRYR